MVATTTALADLQFGPEYAAYIQEKSIELNAFVQSGVAEVDPQLDALAAGQGGTYDLPFYKDLAKTDPNISSDDDSVQGARKKITTGMQAARLHMYNQIWSASDLSKALVANDPLDAIGMLTANYWATWSQKMILQSALGVLADNIANDSGDMLVNLATINDASGGAAARKLQVTSLIDGLQTMGDAKNAIGAIGVHSILHASLQKQGALLEHYDPETGKLAFETLMGKRLIIDDAMPVGLESINDGAGAANKTVYTSILFGNGAFKLGNGMPKKAVATERDEKAGNGAGVEDLIERKHMIVHPVGFKWTNASVANVPGATSAELATAANWDRVFNRKNVPLAFIKSRLS